MNTASGDTHDMPKPLAERDERARAIFLELGTLSGPALEAELARLAANDQPLHDAIRKLLEAHKAASEAGFMAGPAPALAIVPLSEKPGTRIGPYKLLQLIGEGGFGTVFLAEQLEPVRRRIALKIIKLGMDSKSVVARFEAERQALAMMNHPHIARVFDGGLTDSGRPYFVMEYVVGDAITAFADAHKLGMSERLGLFEQVCRAVQHAHQKGIIHRDIKPANVLTSMVDGKPFAKVIDFGIAKATATPLTEKTLFTEHRQLIGTPEYMSPEQAEGSPDIDTRADVYALGVLLYELLTGLTPLDGKRLRSAQWNEMVRIIREEDPPPPSVRVARSLETQAKAAENRRVEPSRLSTLVKGELDWIVMKSLEKERARRYDTPSALADDLLRHLSGEPVVAAPPSAAYRVRKFVRRHKARVIAAGVVVSVLVVGIAGTTWQWRRAETARQAERVRRDQADFSAYIANLAAAHSAMANANWHQARKRLADCPERLRGWEWRLLSDWAGQVVAAIRCEGWMYVEKSRSILVSLNYNSSGLQAYDLEGKSVGAVIPSTYLRNGVPVTDDCQRVLAATDRDRDGHVRVRLTRLNGDPIGPWIAIRLRDQDANLSMSTSGSHVLALSADYALTLASTHDGAVKMIDVPYSAEPLTFCTFTKTGKHIWALNTSGVIRLWDLEGRELYEPLKARRGTLPFYDDESRTWRISQEDVLGEAPIEYADILPDSADHVRSPPQYSRSDQTPFYVVADGTSAGTALKDDAGTASATFLASVPPDRRPLGDGSAQVATTRHDGKIWLAGESTRLALWRPSARTPIEVRPRSWAWTSRQVFSPDSSAAVLDDAGTLLFTNEFGDVTGSLRPQDLPYRVRPSYGLTPQWSADGSVVLSRITGWDAGEGMVIVDPDSTRGRQDWLLQPLVSYPVLGAREGVNDVKVELLAAVGGAYSDVSHVLNDGRLIEVNTDGMLIVSYPGDQERTNALPLDTRVTIAVVSPDKTRIVAACSDWTVRFIDANTLTELVSIPVPQPVTSLRFGADGTRLGLLLADGSARLWDSRDNAQRAAEGMPLQPEWDEAHARVDELLTTNASEKELIERVSSDPDLNPFARVATLRVLNRRFTDIRQWATTAYERCVRSAICPDDVVQILEQTPLPERVRAAIIPGMFRDTDSLHYELRCEAFEYPNGSRWIPAGGSRKQYECAKEFWMTRHSLALSK